jgi:2,3-bisphosphoglycerate-dependent phosphoglycerate mutase
MSTDTVLLVMRHAASRASERNQFLNCSDPLGLSDPGHDQATSAARALASEELTSITTSPLLRAAETAAIIAQATGLSPTAADQAREIDVGDLEGRAGPLAWSAYDETIRAWLSGAAAPTAFTGGETLQAAVSRFTSLLASLARHPGRHLIVTHGGIIRAALPAIATNISGEYAYAHRIAAGGIVRLAFHDPAFVCTDWGDHALPTAERGRQT